MNRGLLRAIARQSVPLPLVCQEPVGTAHVEFVPVALVPLDPTHQVLVTGTKKVTIIEEEGASSGALRMLRRSKRGATIRPFALSKRRGSPEWRGHCR